MNKIAAIPTTYKNVRFRSRLEASWAAFFDLCSWPWEYEPVDMAGYIPDFAIYPYVTRNDPGCMRWVPDRSRAYFLEVKPTTTLDQDACDKMFRASCAYALAATTPKILGLVLLGSGPVTGSHPWLPVVGWMLNGWFLEKEENHSLAKPEYWWHRCLSTTVGFRGVLLGDIIPDRHITFQGVQPGDAVFIENEYLTLCEVEEDTPAFIADLWRKARNLAQYKGDRADG